MTDKFVVDVTVFPYPPNSPASITLKDHHVKFEGRKIKMLKASSFETVREYDCSILLYKPMKHPGQKERMVLPIQFASAPGMKLVFHDSNRDYVGYVIEEFNKFLEANKNQVHHKRVNIENVPIVNPQKSITPSIPTKKRKADWESEVERKRDSKQTVIRLDNAINYTHQNEQVEDLNLNNEKVSNGDDNVLVEQNREVPIKGELITDDKDALSKT